MDPGLRRMFRPLLFKYVLCEVQALLPSQRMNSLTCCENAIMICTRSIIYFESYIKNYELVFIRSHYRCFLHVLNHAHAHNFAQERQHPGGSLEYGGNGSSSSLSNECLGRGVSLLGGVTSPAASLALCRSTISMASASSALARTSAAVGASTAPTWVAISAAAARASRFWRLRLPRSLLRLQQIQHQMEQPMVKTMMMGSPILKKRTSGAYLSSTLSLGYAL